MKRVGCCVTALALMATMDAHAVDMDNRICTAAGYYEAEGNQFMYEIAQRVIVKNKLNSGYPCSEASKRGADVARKYKLPGKVVSADDQRVIEAANHFGNAVYDAILSRIKFD